MIAVYTITKNEAKHIKRWAESAADADCRIVLDTGSDDDTVQLATDAGCVVYKATIDPWRFDVARNLALAYVPADMDLCIALDADEVLLPGWRAHLDSLPKEITRPRYKYTWSWNPDGSPGLMYFGDKIHARHGYVWKHPVHEVLDPHVPEAQQMCGLEIHHFPDSTKPRSYLPLLELAVKEDPEDDRNAHYLAREYLAAGDVTRAAAQFRRHLSLSRAIWPPERAKSMRLLAVCEPDQAEGWLLRAAAEDSGRREPWIELAQHYYHRGDWASCYAHAERALAINDRDLLYLNEAWAWGPLAYDLAAIAAWNLGLKEQAARRGAEALALAPTDERLATNLAWYTDEVD